VARVQLIVPVDIAEAPVVERILARLKQSPDVETCEWSVDDSGWEKAPFDILIYFPGGSRPGGLDLVGAERVFDAAAGTTCRRVVLISSAEVYVPSPKNSGFIIESRQATSTETRSLTGQWQALEERARRVEAAGKVLTILRPTTVLDADGSGFFDGLFGSRLGLVPTGYDPSIQLLAVDDLAGAVCAATARETVGVYNVAPDGVIPLCTALRWSRTWRLLIPRFLQRVVRGLGVSLGLTHPSDQLEYVRYSWTVSNDKMKSDLGFVPQRTTPGVLLDFLAARYARRNLPADIERPPTFDDFGIDLQYIASHGRTDWRYLHDVHWRIKARGHEHIPARGRAVLTGMHRGFMPLDGLMTMYHLFRKTGRVPRFLIHPTLFKFAFHFNLFTKTGCMIASGENADRVLQDDELLGFYPEGIRGAFTHYKEAYTLRKFGRDEFVKAALRNQAPIVPFVTVGNAEIFPILAKINWGWWKRFTMWPAFPIAPPFPFLPIPLPSKWHIQFLPPIHVERMYPPEAAEDLETVRKISRQVRSCMQEAVDDMRRRRRWIFFGSIDYEAGGD
jgi:1-acyl-sn-glycerol-3-phosphate acyltransferase/nucleoside-diphosphate-sugar epimerase